MTEGAGAVVLSLCLCLLVIGPIAWLLAEGDSVEQIAAKLSMDSQQVRLINGG